MDAPVSTAAGAPAEVTSSEVSGSLQKDARREQNHRA